MLRFYRALDREERAQYILTVAADLPNTASTATFRVFVTVLDINDNPPVFEQVCNNAYCIHSDSLYHYQI